MMTLVFQHPYVLALIVLVPVLFIATKLFVKPSTLLFPSLTLVKDAKAPRGSLSVYVPRLLRMLVLVLIIIALARPQTRDASREFNTEGIDIIITLDISGSMKAEDFQPANRLEVAKEEAKKFIQGRKHDRIGLVVFAQQSITQCPLTMDYGVLLDLLGEVQIGHIKDGTAIGLAVTTAVNRLRDSTAKSKVIILITDGENNAGQIDPITAAEVAKSFGIKTYTIGVGKGGLVPYPVDDPLFGRRYTNVEVKIDEHTLKRIANITGGMYFRARDQKSLQEIYEKINQLEKTEIKIKEYLTLDELFPWLILPALCILMLEIAIRHLLLIKIP